MKVIKGDRSLSAFRKKWNPNRILDLIAQSHGRLQIVWAIGVGKSYSIDDTVETAIRSQRYDLAVVLLPTRHVLSERRWIRPPPDDVHVIDLRPRPTQDCGPLNTAWERYEENDLGLLGRVDLCGQCPKRSACFWPNQYGKSLKGAQVIFATQAHLERSPGFTQQLKNWTRAERVLVLLDEINFIMRPFSRTIDRNDLEQFVDVLKEVKRKSQRLERWWYLTSLLRKCSTEDLRAPEWNFPWLHPKSVLEIQRRGYSRIGDSFKFIGFDLRQFGFSPGQSRERDPAGNIHYATPPYLGCDFVIYSGTASHEFSEFRLGERFESPFESYRFEHPDTVWYNLASNIGTKRFFLKNSDQILDFFAALTASRLNEDKRVLLVAKKCFIQECADGIQLRLRELGCRDTRVITDEWNRVNLSDPKVVPLINYGVVGSNLFEEFDCVFCLTGYYVNEQIINSVLQDVTASDFHIPVRISTSGYPRRRSAAVSNPPDRIYDVNKLAQLALNQQEMDVVLQAVGRVRPYTKPREVLTFQCSAHPLLEYTAEFNSLAQARAFFGISTRRERRQAELGAGIHAARTQGLSQSEAASKLDTSLSTVKRHWNKGGVTNPL